jgi:hypothetical protein
MSPCFGQGADGARRMATSATRVRLSAQYACYFFTQHPAPNIIKSSRITRDDDGSDPPRIQVPHAPIPVASSSSSCRRSAYTSRHTIPPSPAPVKYHRAHDKSNLFGSTMRVCSATRSLNDPEGARSTADSSPYLLLAAFFLILISELFGVYGVPCAVRTHREK